MISRAKIVVITLLSLIAFSFTSYNGPVKTYSVDVSASNIEWRGEKVTGFHTGNISLKEGSFEFVEDVLTGGSFVVDMNTITNTDLKKEEMAAKLIGHLKSSDFFGVETYPTATFVIKQVISRGTPGSYKIVGDITIKETTKEIKFNATVNQTDAGVEASADIVLDRSDFNVRYGSGSFFDNLGDKTIYDEFKLSLHLVGSAS